MSSECGEKEWVSWVLRSPHRFEGFVVCSGILRVRREKRRVKTAL